MEVRPLTDLREERRMTTSPLDDLPLTISVEEAARILGISRSSAYRGAASGDLPVGRLGRRLRVPSAALRQLLSPPWGHVAAVADGDSATP